MELASKLGPQVVIVDLHMKDENLVTPSLIKERLVDSKLLIISVWNDQETKDLAAAYGATTLLDKGNLATELIPAVKHCVK
jgi:DNA-binding NarL/FixJ family response regulator